MEELTTDELLKIFREANRSPTSKELEVAPYINPYRFVDTGRGFQGLYGPVEGHPIILDPYITTTPVLGFDPDAGWARTRSRLYRLGPDWQFQCPGGRDEMLSGIQDYLRVIREFVISELLRNRELSELAESRRNETPIDRSIEDL